MYIFSQGIIISIQTVNGFLIFYKVAWVPRFQAEPNKMHKMKPWTQNFILNFARIYESANAYYVELKTYLIGVARSMTLKRRIFPWKFRKRRNKRGHEIWSINLFEWRGTHIYSLERHFYEKPVKINENPNWIF